SLSLGGELTGRLGFFPVLALGRCRLDFRYLARGILGRGRIQPGQLHRVVDRQERGDRGDEEEDRPLIITHRGRDLRARASSKSFWLIRRDAASLWSDPSGKSERVGSARFESPKANDRQGRVLREGWPDGASWVSQRPCLSRSPRNGSSS